jgi:putative transcriptional regulator
MPPEDEDFPFNFNPFDPESEGDDEDQEDEEPVPDLEGQLLVAHPGLLDPNFRRSIIYVPAHDPEDGAMGLILNRPSGKTAGELLPTLEIGQLEDVPVYFGGPVGGDQLTFAVLDRDQQGKVYARMRHISVQEALELHGDPTYILRAFLGYAGWDGGQLEDEIHQNAWLIRDPRFEDLLCEDVEKAWKHSISWFGPVYKLMAEAPDDPGLN